MNSDHLDPLDDAKQSMRKLISDIDSLLRKVDGFRARPDETLYSSILGNGLESAGKVFLRRYQFWRLHVKFRLSNPSTKLAFQEFNSFIEYPNSTGDTYNELLRLKQVIEILIPTLNTEHELTSVTQEEFTMEPVYRWTSFIFWIVLLIRGAVGLLLAVPGFFKKETMKSAFASAFVFFVTGGGLKLLLSHFLPNVSDANQVLVAGTAGAFLLGILGLKEKSEK